MNKIVRIFIFLTLGFYCYTVSSAQAGSRNGFISSSPRDSMNHPAVTVTRDVLILMDKSEEEAVKRTVQDLVRDLKKVFGVAPRIIASIVDAGKNVPVIVITCKGDATREFRDPDITEFEEHLVTTRDVGGHQTVVLQGADMRGTIYAIYTFSEKILGIPPLWIWASFEPPMKKQVQVPWGTYLFFSSPAVKWRAWFPNDVDLLDPWQRKNGENYDALFETMLRLKLNTREGYLMDAKSWDTINKAGKEACYARDRGLKISFTHTAPFGAIYQNWENFWTKIMHQKTPELLLKDVESLKTFWRYHIEVIRKEELDVIWQIGFRGKGDKPFWSKTFADTMDLSKEDSDRANIIGSMLLEEIALLKKVTGEQHPIMKTTIYNESSDLLAAGLLHLPDEPALILNFSSVRKDHFPPPDIQHFSISGNRPIGYYMNFQFTGTGSHLAPAEGPWKMEQNFRYVESKIKHPLTFSVVNAGNIREHVLELSSNAAMMWNTASYKTDDFLKEYCKTYFGDSFANDIASLYKEFYYSYWGPRKAFLPGFDRQYIFQDMRYARGIEQICALWDYPYLENPFNDKNQGLYGAMDTGGRQYNIVPADNNTPNQVEATIIGTEESAVHFQNVGKRADVIYQQLPLQKQVFFNDDIRLQAMFMSEVNKALNNIVRAYKEKHNGETAQCKTHVEMALKSVMNLKDIKAQADHGRFNDWYENDKNFNINGLLKRIMAILKKIK
jgi:hypothetical protein